MWALLYIVPFVIGIAVAVFKLEFAVSWVASFASWLDARRNNNIGRYGFIRRWVLRPFYWGATGVMNLTSGITNEYLQTGVRIVAFTYFIFIFAFITYVAAIFVLALAVVAIVLWIVFTVIGASDGGTRIPTRPKPERPEPRREGKKRRAGRGKYKGQNVYVDENGLMRNADAGMVAYVSEDGSVTEGRLIGTDGYMNDHGDISDGSLSGGNIGHIDRD